MAKKPTLEELMDVVTELTEADTIPCLLDLQGYFPGVHRNTLLALLEKANHLELIEKRYHGDHQKFYYADAKIAALERRIRKMNPFRRFIYRLFGR